MKTKTSGRTAENASKGALGLKGDVFSTEKTGKTPTLDPKKTTFEAKNVPENASERANNETSQAGRVVIAYFEDEKGRPDLSRMRPVIKERLRAFVTDPQVIKSLGIEKNAVVPEPIQVFDPAWTGTLYDAVGFIESIFAQKFWDLSAEDAKRIFTFSTMEKEKLAAPTARVMNKYAAQWMILFKDEIALAMLLFSLTAAKMMAAKMISEMQHAPNNPANRKPRVVPASQAQDTEVKDAVNETANDAVETLA